MPTYDKTCIISIVCCIICIHKYVHTGTLTYRSADVLSFHIIFQFESEAIIRTYVRNMCDDYCHDGHCSFWVHVISVGNNMFCKSLHMNQYYMIYHDNCLSSGCCHYIGVSILFFFACPVYYLQFSLWLLHSLNVQISFPFMSISIETISIFGVSVGNDIKVCVFVLR